MVQDCFICRKHAGLEASPPGGYVYEDAHWKVCHAPPTMAHVGTMLVESTRHYVDFADMQPGEATTYGVLLHTLYMSLKQVTSAERIYSLVLLDGTPHFHAWFIPRPAVAPERGIDWITHNACCNEQEAQAIAIQLRAHLTS